MNRVIISYGLTESSPTIPPRMTVLSIHVEAHNRSTPITGAVSSPNVKCNLFWTDTAAAVSAAVDTLASAFAGIDVFSAVAVELDFGDWEKSPFRLKSRERKYGRGIRRGKITRASNEYEYCSLG